MLLDPSPLALAPLLELCDELLELVPLGVHADQALEELDLVGPDLLILNALALVVLLVDGRLEHHGHAREAVVVHDAVEGAQAQEAGADVGVEVAVGAEGGLAVVEVESPEVLVADDFVERAHGGLEGLGRAEVVAGGEGVARVDADADPADVVDLGDDVPQVLEGGAHDVAAARHVLQHGDDRGRGLVRPVELGGDAPARRGPRVPARVARVEVVQPHAEALAALQVVEEARVRLLGLGLVRLRQVDEVAAVRERVRRGVVRVLLAVGEEEVLGLSRQGGVVPLALRFHEERERIGANLHGVGDCVLHALWTTVSFMIFLPLGPSSFRFILGRHKMTHERGKASLPPAALTCAPMYMAFFSDAAAVRSARGIASSSLAFPALRFLFVGGSAAGVVSAGSAFRFLGVAAAFEGVAVVAVVAPLAALALALVSVAPFAVGFWSSL